VYVIRRLIRRAVMQGQKQGSEEAVRYKLVPVVGKIKECASPEVLEQAEFIEKEIKMDEDRVSDTMHAGMQLSDSTLDETKKEGGTELPGKPVFKLYDTYGFPLELTKEYANDEGLDVDEEGFNEEMEQQKERARAARSDAKSMGVQNGLLTDIT